MAYRRKGIELFTPIYAKCGTLILWLMKINIRKFYEALDKREVAKALVPVLNKTVSKGHTWQQDDNGNIYILRGPFIITKL